MCQNINKQKQTNARGYKFRFFFAVLTLKTDLKQICLDVVLSQIPLPSRSNTILHVKVPESASRSLYPGEPDKTS